ncbi:MAG: CotS family spore coat protein [Clostridia bacterium]|nr:CotS family spore coat protein [Clostridia bacterium]
MMLENQEPLDIVLTEYLVDSLGIRNESYKEKKGVWWIQTPTGNRILKKMSHSESILKHMLSAMRHLRGNGVNLPTVYLTKENEEYVNINGTCFILIEAIDGKNPNYTIPQELAAVVKGLANLHKASGGFSTDLDSKPAYCLGTWIKDYEEQLEDMNRFYQEELAKSAPDDIGKVVLREFPHFFERGRKAVDGLKGPEYAEWVERVRHEGCLCHQDFAAGNLLLQPSGNLCVIDTDDLTVDIPSRDIRKLFNKIMKKKGYWDTALTKKIMELYQSENPLTASQWTVVKLDLLFPHLFIGAMSKYYYKKDKDWGYDKYFRSINEMSRFEKTYDTVFDQFDSMISQCLNEGTD